MTKNQITHAISEKTGFSMKESVMIFDAIVDIIKKDIIKNKKSKVSGLGIFEIRNTSARIGHNFKNGTKIQLEPRKMVRFRAGKALKFKLNKYE